MRKERPCLRECACSGEGPGPQYVPAPLHLWYDLCALGEKVQVMTFTLHLFSSFFFFFKKTTTWQIKNPAAAISPLEVLTPMDNFSTSHWGAIKQEAPF